MYNDREAEKQGSMNVNGRVLDVNNLKSLKKDYSNGFDFVISIEMFEHMKNYGKLMNDISHILSQNGKLFVHIFVHNEIPYHFEIRNDNDWMSKYFFSAGTMPSYMLLPTISESKTNNVTHANDIDFFSKKTKTTTISMINNSLLVNMMVVKDTTTKVIDNLLLANTMVI